MAGQPPKYLGGLDTLVTMGYCLPMTQTQQSTVQVGSVFVCSWGYDQTNVDFFKVVGMTKSGKSVKVQKWSSKITGTDRVAVDLEKGPATLSFYNHNTGERDTWTAPVETKRLRMPEQSGASRPCFSMASYSSAYLVDPDSEHYATIHSSGH